MTSRTEMEILEEMVERANNINLIDINDDDIEKIKNGLLLDNQYVLDLDIHAFILNQLEVEIEEIKDSIDIDHARGEALDILGKLLNIQRIPAAPSYLDLNITLPIAEPENIVIPEGTRVVFEEIFQNNSDYITSQEYTINAGVTDITIQAESLEYGYQDKIPSGVVKGLENFPNLEVTNLTESTHGKYIEDDQDYRNRLKKSLQINQIGTRACIEDYLLNLDYVDSFILIPSYNGVGTLKIIVDTLESYIDIIQDGIINNCLLVSDLPPLIVLPTSTLLNSLTVYITKSLIPSSLTDDELKQLIIQQCKSFIEGGVNRSGQKVEGLGIGENFNPSQLLSFLNDQFIEVDNIRLSQQSVVPVNPDTLLKVDTITVVIE